MTTDAAGDGGGPQGVGGTGGIAGGEGGRDGSEKPGGCTEEADCHGFGDCSTIPDLEAECRFRDLTSYPTSCGGTYVEHEGAVTLEAWVFDARGELIGGSSEDEGSCSWWGSTCGPVGKGVDFCDDTNECVEHDGCDIWGANFDCPERLADVDALCELGDIEVQRYASDCGTVVHAFNGIQDVDYSFDADGKLIGVQSLGDVGDCDYWGTHCAPRGAAEELCGAGGAGGSGGAGGAGGADNGGAGQ